MGRCGSRGLTGREWPGSRGRAWTDDWAGATRHLVRAAEKAELAVVASAERGLGPLKAYSEGVTEF